MVEPLRHRQTKEAATDMLDLQPPRHIPTPPFATDPVPTNASCALIRQIGARGAWVVGQAACSARAWPGVLPVQRLKACEKAPTS